MSELNTEYLDRCISTLEKAFLVLQKISNDALCEERGMRDFQQLIDDNGNVAYDICRAACVKEFEIILEQTGKLLKKCLKPYFATPKQVDQLNFKDIFRHAAKYGLFDADEAERWLRYRDNRNDTAHDYGAGFADDTLTLLPQFIADARRAHDIIRQYHD
jgi:nucleotidyltransferase substrate binding protein (TIGR01987 family)